MADKATLEIYLVKTLSLTLVEAAGTYLMGLSSHHAMVPKGTTAPTSVSRELSDKEESQNLTSRA